MSDVRKCRKAHWGRVRAKAPVQVGGINIICQVSGGTGGGEDVAGLGADFILTRCKACQETLIDINGLILEQEPCSRSSNSTVSLEWISAMSAVPLYALIGKPCK